MERNNKWQKIAASAYAGGDMLHAARDYVNCGDGLFEFIMRELEEADNFESAHRLMERARDEVEQVIDALRRKG